MAIITGTAKRFFSYSFKVYNRSLRITREGWFFVGFTFAVGVAAINTGNNLMYMVLAMMLGVMAMSGVLSESVLSKIKVERRPPGEVWAARPFEVEYGLANPRRLPSYSLRIREKGIESMKEPFVLKLGAGARATVSGVFQPPRRGVLEFKQAMLFTRFPFAFFEKTKLVNMKDRVIVFPAPLYESGESEGADERGLDESCGIKGDGAGLFGLREYRNGDNPRRIHWKSTAKTGKIIMKETEASDLPKIALFLDTSGYRPGRDEQALEMAISRCAGLAIEHIEKNFFVRLVSCRGEVPYGGGREHLRSILAHLALFEPKALVVAPMAVRRGEAHIIIELSR